jgi:hypothetical protein
MGINVTGADTYEGIYESWNSNRAKILKIEKNFVPAPDKYFSAVVSNQVLEHIPPHLVPEVAREVTRLIADSGVGYHIFPTKKTIIEPHVGIIGAHWFKRNSTLQKYYLAVSFKLGFGYWRSENKRGRHKTRTCDDWVASSQFSLANHCYFVSRTKWVETLRKESTKVEDVSYLLALYALPKVIWLDLITLSKRKVIRYVLNQLVHFRVGVVVKITR